jgi:hypothetical protein
VERRLNEPVRTVAVYGFHNICCPFFNLIVFSELFCSKALSYEQQAWVQLETAGPPRIVERRTFIEVISV